MEAVWAQETVTRIANIERQKATRIRRRRKGSHRDGTRKNEDGHGATDPICARIGTEVPTDTGEKSAKYGGTEPFGEKWIKK